MKIPLFFSLLQLGLLACACCETCPPPEDIAPCTCKPSAIKGKIDIDCDSVSLQEIDDAFDNLRGKTIDAVTIKSLKADRLSSFLFWNTRVRRITIVGGDLQGLSDSDRRPAFSGLEDSLESLSVSRSIKGDNHLKTLDLSHLKKLNFLYLFGNNITEVGNDWFAKGPLSLTHVKFIFCGVSTLGDTAFAPLANLQSLSLFGNRLESLKRSMLPNPASHLNVMELENNNFPSLSYDIFSGMPSLETVYLKDNSIRRIDKLTWSSMWEQLDHLDLGNNPLECSSHMEWLFSLKRPKTLLGTCASPLSVKGERLLYFIEINRKLLALTGKSWGYSSNKDLLIA